MKKKIDRKAGKSSFKCRSARGVNALEVAINAFLVIVITAITVDVSLVFLANSINDSACRDAARAAGAVVSTNTDTYSTTQAKALASAQAQMTVHKTDGFLITGLTGGNTPTLTMPVFYCPPTGTGTTDSVTGQWGPSQTYSAANPATGASASAAYPYVQCTTAVLVRLPVGAEFFGVTLNHGNQLKFTRSYVYPMVRTKMVGG
jgi:Flp pilus assembly protein TadG